MARLFTIVLLLTLALMVAAGQPKTIHVPQDHATIQAAINAASDGDTVLIAEGTYAVNLVLAKRIVLGSLFLIDRDTAHISRTILDGGTPRNIDSGSVILALPGTDTSTVICGLTVRRGSGTKIVATGGTVWLGGGGILAIGSGLTVTHCRIVQNRTEARSGVPYTYGGGMGIGWTKDYQYYSIITDNLIANNVSSGTTADGAGLSIGMRGRIERNIIERNSGSSTMTDGAAGGISIWAGPGDPVSLRSNIIRLNASNQSGGGVSIHLDAASTGPAVSMVNNLIVGNTAVTLGGGIDLRMKCSLILINNTIADNDGAWGSGLFVRGTTWSARSLVAGFNNIFWNKYPDLSEIVRCAYGSLHHNLIRGFSLLGDNNFSADPGFATDGSYSLAANSPCIGAGTSARTVRGLSLQAPLDDIYGRTRPLAAGTSPDLGAIESELGTTSASRTPTSDSRAIAYGGYTRAYAVRRPPGRESEQNLGILFMLHGYGGDATQAMNLYHAEITGDSLGFLTVHPDAVGFKWNSGISENPSWPAPTVDDVGFISALIDSLHAQYGADTNRVFVMGHSNGGFMTYRLALQLSRRIRRAATMGAVLPTSYLTSAVPAIHIPMLMMHGTSDPTVPFGGTTGWSSVPATLEFWRALNESFSGEDVVQMPNLDPSDGSTVERHRYADANGRRMVWYYGITGGGHEWPGVSHYAGEFNTNRDIHASREIYSFFADSLTGRTVDLSRSVVDFGNRLVSTNNTTLVTVANPASSALTITGATMKEGRFTIAQVPSFPVTLSPGASIDIHIAFHPAQTGVFLDTLTLEGPAVGQPLARVPVVGQAFDAVTPAQADTIYVIQYGSATSNLYSLKPVSLAPTLRGPLGTSSIRSIAIDYRNGVIYGASSSYGIMTLYRISTSSGIAVTDRVLSLPDLAAITIGRADTLYAGTTTGSLFRVSLDSGSIAPVGSGTGLSLTALAYNHFNGVCWAASRLPSGGLYVIDVRTGSARAKAGLPFTSPVKALSFDGYGRLYALIDDGAGKSYLATIDTTTGEPTLVSEFDIGLSSLSGLAIWPGPAHVGGDGSMVPSEYALSQNYPNPFNPETRIGYRMKERGWVKLSVMNILGQQVAVLVDEEKEAGYHEAVFSGQSSVVSIPSGVYFYRISVSSGNGLPAAANAKVGHRYEATRKMVMIK